MKLAHPQADYKLWDITVGGEYPWVEVFGGLGDKREGEGKDKLEFALALSLNLSSLKLINLSGRIFVDIAGNWV